LGKYGDSKNNHEDTKNTKFSMNQLSVFLRVFVVKNAFSLIWIILKLGNRDTGFSVLRIAPSQRPAQNAVV